MVVLIGSVFSGVAKVAGWFPAIRQTLCHTYCRQDSIQLWQYSPWLSYLAWSYRWNPSLRYSPDHSRRPHWPRAQYISPHQLASSAPSRPSWSRRRRCHQTIGTSLKLSHNHHTLVTRSPHTRHTIATHSSHDQQTMWHWYHNLHLVGTWCIILKIDFLTSKSLKQPFQ